MCVSCWGFFFLNSLSGLRKIIIFVSLSVFMCTDKPIPPRTPRLSRLSVYWDFSYKIILDGMWLFLDDRRDRPARFCCIIWVVWVDFCFGLHSCDQKYSRFDYFLCILECCFFFSLLSSVCVCGGGVGRSAGRNLSNPSKLSFDITESIKYCSFAF